MSQGFFEICDNLTKDDILEVSEMDYDYFLLTVKNTSTDIFASIMLTKKQIKELNKWIMELLK